MIVNPTAGRRGCNRLNGVIAALRDRGCIVTVRETSAPGDAKHLVADANICHFDVLAIAGGDGTINDVLNAVENHVLPVAIVPIGTANVLAAESNLQSSIRMIADTIACGSACLISLGEANGRRFAVMASVGLDAEVVANVSLTLKRYVGKGAYVCETMRQIVVFDPPTYQMRIEGIVHEAHGVVVANGHFYGGRYIAAPDARLDKPDLDICRRTRPGRLAAAHYLASMACGRLEARQDYKIDVAKSIEITGPAGAAVQADGDILTHLPATIRVLPQAVSLIYPLDQA